ncbi:MAG TPA: hypothetical protein PKA90_12645 [Ignavibacteria bacterium]|nr:hypothetical protein [Ignavibacteria bacterium]HMR41268.1 hypothetical protein [Ignavibacteria bacterium]
MKFITLTIFMKLFASSGTLLNTQITQEIYTFRQNATGAVVFINDDNVTDLNDSALVHKNPANFVSVITL